LSSAALTPFSYVILALVGENGAGPHDLLNMMRRGRPYWAAAPSHYYYEPKRLERLGYLAARKERGRTRPKTHYTLTSAGRAALERWVGEPTPFPRIQNEAIVRLLCGDLVEDDVVLESLRALRPQLAEISAGLDEAERIAQTLPHRERYLLLNHSLGRRLMAALAAWLVEVETELGGPAARPRPSSRRTARR
jgi:DNA-binding PadR family transcriptional regulator